MFELTDAANIELESATNELLSVDRTDEAAANRWTKYGYDRLYLEGPAKFEKNSTYVNLKTGELEDAPSRKHSAEVTVEGETATVEIHKDGKGHIYTLTLTVGGEDFNPVKDGDDSEDEPEMACDGGEDVTYHVDDETSEDAIAQHDDRDHEDATAVERVRDLLAAIQESAEEGWYEYVDHIEDGDWQVIAETDDTVLLDTGETQICHQEIELHPEAEYRGEIERDVINGLMHELAADISDRRWPATYPLVVRKPEGAEDGQQYVEAVINSLMRRDLSPGQAWAYYGVEIRGESMNRWGKRKGDYDHKNVSDALEKAKGKLP